jgi:hypothetical protein
MPVWMWLNIPLMVLVIAAVVGIPYWLVLKHPDEDAPTLRRPARTAGTARTTRIARTPVTVPAQARYEEGFTAAYDDRYAEDYSERRSESYGEDRVAAANGHRDYEYSNR